MLQAEPRSLVGRWFLGETLVELGQHEAARRELESALELAGRGARILGYLGYAHGRAGRRDDANAVLAELAERRSGQYLPRYFDAIVHAGLDDTAAALAALEAAYAEKDSMLRDLKVDPPWRGFQEQPRYREILRRLGLS